MTKRPRRKPREYLIRQKTDYEAALARRSIELIRDGLAPEHSPDRLAGFSLGKLLLRDRIEPDGPMGIDERQFNAGCEWAALVHRYAHIMGYRLTPASPDFMRGGGASLASELPAVIVWEIKSKYRECDAILNGNAVMRRVVWGVCIENWPVGMLIAEDYGALREGLNALDRCLSRR